MSGDRVGPAGHGAQPETTTTNHQAGDNHEGTAHGRQLTLTGLDLAELNTDPWWASNVRRAIEALASTRRPFSADDLREQFGLADPDHPNRWGAAFAAAHRDGIIKPTGRLAVSRRRSRASGTAREWIGVPRHHFDVQRDAAAA